MDKTRARTGLEAEIRRDVERIFEEKRRRLGVDAKLDLHVEIVKAPPIVDENVYGEAFPFENPPRVWIEVFPEATTREITKIVCEELLHIKHPGLSEGEIAKMVPACVEGSLEEERRRDILRRAGYEALPFDLKGFYREVERIYEEAWPRAERFLKKHGYKFGRKEFEQVGFHALDVVEAYRNSDETARNIAHEIIEMEEIHRKTGELVVPRFWSEEQEKKTGISQYKWLTPIHYKAEEIVEKYPDC